MERKERCELYNNMVEFVMYERERHTSNRDVYDEILDIVIRNEETTDLEKSYQELRELQRVYNHEPYGGRIEPGYFICDSIIKILHVNLYPNEWRIEYIEN